MKTKKKLFLMINNYDKKIEQFKKKGAVEEIPEDFLKEYKYFHSLLEITHSINTPQDFNILLEHIIDAAITLTRAERGFLMLFSKERNLEFRVTRNIDKETIESERFDISKSVVNQVLATGKPLFLSAIYKDKKFKITESIETLGLHMVMCVPIKTRENILGLIYVDSHSETADFTKVEEKIFEAFAAQASLAIENSHLYDSSVHDALTGLYDYGYLRLRLEEEIIRASDYKKGSISFIMLDLDNFKSINDSYGHQFGNTLLVRVAEVIKKTIRKYDVAARYGGDEFAVLMPDADVGDARYFAQRIQKEIIESRSVLGKATISMSASIGISTFPLEKIVDSENVIIEADHALLLAKGKGGNQIVVFELREDAAKVGPELIGKSEVLDEVRTTVSKLARTDATLLIIGETGTGKELITKLVHKSSERAARPLIVVNCGAIPDNLLESELFGYEKGAFTGAYTQRKGKFEQAHGGTIFLDEVGELPLHLQVKILRALEQREIDRIGSRSPIKVDVRVIAATNKNLEEEVKLGRFRKDLFYRLSVATVNLPPLRERPEDIEALSGYYLDQMNKIYRRKISGFTKGAIEVLLKHQWPGNVRELIHRIERAIIMTTGQYLNENDLGLATVRLNKSVTLKELRGKAEKEGITETLVRNHWNITHASKELGISRKALRDLIKKHSIVKSDIIAK